MVHREWGIDENLTESLSSSVQPKSVCLVSFLCYLLHSHLKYVTGPVCRDAGRCLGFNGHWLGADLSGMQHLQAEDCLVVPFPCGAVQVEPACPATCHTIKYSQQHRDWNAVIRVLIMNRFCVETYSDRNLRDMSESLDNPHIVCSSDSHWCMQTQK